MKNYKKQEKSPLQSRRVFVLGRPCSGKTSFIGHLLEKYKRMDLKGGRVSIYSPLDYSHLDVCIYETPFEKFWKISITEEEFPQTSIFYISTPYALCLARNKASPFPLSEEIMESYERDIELERLWEYSRENGIEMCFIMGYDPTKEELRDYD